MFQGKYPGRFDTPKRIGCGPWLDLIHAANGIQPEFFGAPTYDETDTERATEIYPHAVVVHCLDDPERPVIVAATDEHGHWVLVAAEAVLKAQEAL